MALARRVARTVAAEGAAVRGCGDRAVVADLAAARSSTVPPGRLAGAGLRAARGRRHPAPAEDDQGDARDDDPARDQLRSATTVSPRISAAEEDRDHRVHEGVGRDERQRRVPQDPGVRRERDEAADRDEVDERDERLGATPSAGSKVAQLAGQRRDDAPRTTPPESICIPVVDERVARQPRPVGREERAGCPGDRREDQGRDAGRIEGAVDRDRPGRRGR